MLKSHINTVERTLLAISQIPANSGHPLHKGTPREAFIKEFLSSHLSERVAIGTGEIIDAQSKPKESRNQIDIVVYKRDYPKIDFGGGINAFLAESVVATIEVKSNLTKKEFQKSIETAWNVKKLQRNVVTSFFSGYQPPSILSYIVAYDGPAKMDTVHSWIHPIHSNLGLSYPPIEEANGEARYKVISPSIDGVFVLGKGFIQFDNSPIRFRDEQIRTEHPNIKWAIRNTQESNLLLLFILLTNAVSGVSGSWLNPLPYLDLADFQITRGVHFGK